LKRAPLKLVFIVVFILCAFCGHSQTAKIDSLHALIPALDGKELAQAYLELSKEYSHANPSETIRYAEEALKIALKNGNKEQECSSYLRLGAAYISKSKFEEAKSYAEKALVLANEIENPEFEVSALNSLAAYYQSRGQYSESIDFFEQALKKVELSGSERDIALVKVNLGSALTALGDRSKGLLYLFDAMKYFSQSDDEISKALIFNNIAVNYHFWKDYNRALEYYEKAYNAYKATDDFVGWIVALNNIGEIYKDKKEYDKSIGYFTKVVDAADTTKASPYYKAYGWIGLAEVYLGKEDFKEAKYYVDLALPVFEKVNMEEAIATSSLILAQISLNHGSLADGLSQVIRCREIAADCGIIDLIHKSYWVESQILNKLGRSKDAYNSMEKYSAMSDTLYSSELAESFSDIRSSMEIATKQGEIEMLQKYNQIKDLKIKRQKSNTLILSLVVLSFFVIFFFMLGYIKSRKRTNDLLTEKNRQIGFQHDELKKVNETKDKFLSIIGHDLRNPIGAFKDVIGQLADFPEMFTDELRQQIINELRDEAESTYFLLDNLLSWAKSQKDVISYRPEKLDISRLVKTNVQLTKRQADAKNIGISSEINGEVWSYADHNMVNLILRNLISNAIKFTEEGGQVTISAKEQTDYWFVTVKDTGIGIEPKDLEQLFDPNAHLSTYGTNHEKGSGLGLLLCREFIEANGGEITVESQKGKGSSFTFSLKKYSDSI